MPGPAHRVRWVNRHDLTVDQPIEQVAQRRQSLLDRWRSQLACRRLDPGRDVQRLASAIDGTPTSAHQAKNSSDAR